MMENTQEDRTEALVDNEQNQEAEATAETEARPRSQSWFSKFGKSVAGAAKKVGNGAKKLGKNIGDTTKKVFKKQDRDPLDEAPAADAAEGEAGPATEASEEDAATAAAASAPATTTTQANTNRKPKFPAEGMRTATPYGDGVIVILQEGRAVVHLDWCLADGQPARAYIGAELLSRTKPKFIKDAGKVMHKVGDAIAGQNGIFGKNTWAKVGNGMKKAGGAIKATAGKAAHGVSEAFKKKPNAQDPAAQELITSEVEGQQKEEPNADEPAEVEGEGTNPYAAPSAE